MFKLYRDYSNELDGTNIDEISNKIDDSVIVVENNGALFTNEILALSTIADISDVSFTNLQNNDFFIYDNASSSWINKTPANSILSLGITATASELNYSDLSTLGQAENSKVLTFDQNSSSIIPDSFQLKFGTSSDLIITHDGTNSLINNATGALRISAEAGSSSDILIGNSSSSVQVGNNLTVSGNLSVNGTTTTVNSTVTTLDDPIITLGGDTAPSTDDNKDRGVEFRWHNGSAAKLGFFGYDDSASKFTFIPDATNSSEVFSGSAGDVAFGSGEFSGDLIVDTSTLKVDSANNRVGIGTASPLKALHVVDTTSDVEIARFQGGDGNVAIEGGAKITFSRNAINYLSCTHPSGSLRLETGGAGNNRLTIDSTGNSTFTGDVILDNAKSLRLSELDSNGANHISIKAPDSVTANVTLVLPDGAGTNGQALTTDGSGNLSWSSVAGGSVTASNITQGNSNIAFATSSGTLDLTSTDTITVTNTSNTARVDFDLNNVADSISLQSTLSNGDYTRSLLFKDGVSLRTKTTITAEGAGGSGYPGSELILTADVLEKNLVIGTDHAVVAESNGTNIDSSLILKSASKKFIFVDSSRRKDLSGPYPFFHVQKVKDVETDQNLNFEIEMNATKGVFGAYTDRWSDFTHNTFLKVNQDGQITKIGHDTPTNGQVLSWDNTNGYAVWSDAAGGISSSDITGKTEKSTVNDNDLIVLADSEDSNNLKKITRANLVDGLTANNTYATKTANFTASVNHHYSIDTSSGAVNVNLPQMSSTTSGESIVIKFRNGTNFLTLVPYSGNTIEGLNNLILTDSSAPGQSVTLVSSGSSAWEII